MQPPSPEPLLEWSEAATEFVGFVASFLAAGAIGFRYAAVRNRLARVVDVASPRDAGLDDGTPTFYADAVRRAAIIGLLGALVQLFSFVRGLPRAAARAHVTVDVLLTTNVQVLATCVLAIAAVVGLALAASRVRAGWPIAALGVVLGPLTGIVSGQWSRLVNPVHRLVAGLWLGTLFVLVVAGLATLLRDERTRERRGAIAADLVNGFSPLALTCGGILVISGVITALRHLDPFSSLWSTPYGYALIAKLAVVAVVFALGAWNWRRQRPMLGSEDAAHAIRRSSRAELIAATVVLVITAILVSLPSPRAARPPGAPAAPAPAAAAPPASG